MGFKEVLEEEKKELQSVKRPYETVAFLIFAALFVQQAFYLVKGFIDFTSKGWLAVGNFTNANLQGYIVRICGIDNTSWIVVILVIVAWAFYWIALYLLVWNYAAKNHLAKWVWTLYVAFGPTVLFVPAYVAFIAYAYRGYLVRFAKKVVSEFKTVDANQQFPEDQA
ncbi:MAG: hypothetical protein PHP32_05440 [Candidatus Izemoplasmatales bacterium]|nr:hypothetical protein [Candidatus Izemoplasmatales bacterium]